MKSTRILFICVALFALVAGLGVSIYISVMISSFLVAIYMCTLVIVGSAIVYGFGELVVSFQKKNRILAEKQNKVEVE